MVLLITSVDTCCCGVLEIKCPYRIHGNYVVELSPQEIAEKYGDQFCLAKGADDQLHLKIWHPFYAQIQGKMAIMNVAWCDFIVLSGGKIFVDQIWFELLLPKLQTFYVHLAREILSGRHFGVLLSMIVHWYHVLHICECIVWFICNCMKLLNNYNVNNTSMMQCH